MEMPLDKNEKSKWTCDSNFLTFPFIFGFDPKNQGAETHPPLP